MQLYGETNFFVLLVIALIPAFILGIREKQIKYYGMVATAFFIWMSMKDRPEMIAYMFGFVVYGFVLVQVYLKTCAAAGRPRYIYILFLILGIAPLVSYKAMTAAGGTGWIFAFAGISYMTFKLVQMLIEIYDGIIKEVKFTDHVYLMLFFPTLLSGPIDRSRRFESDLKRVISRDEYLDMAGIGIKKILQGMVYKLVIAAVFYLLMEKFGMAHTAEGLLIYLYTYGFYLFFDFAGYSLMAVGTGYLLGIRVPDNFDKPFLSIDIREFWNRWHITLSHWLRDYVFSRITMDMIRSRKFSNKLTIASIALMTNMFIMGCWHGLTANYIVYGLYHGVLLVAFEIISKKSRFYKKHKNEKWFRTIEWFVTLHLVLIGFFIFSGRSSKALAYLLNAVF